MTDKELKQFSNLALVEYAIINLAPNLADEHDLPDQELLDYTIAALREIATRIAELEAENLSKLQELMAQTDTIIALESDCAGDMQRVAELEAFVRKVFNAQYLTVDLIQGAEALLDKGK